MRYKPDLQLTDKDGDGVIALTMQLRQGGAVYNSVEVKHGSEPSTHYLDSLFTARKFVEIGAPVDIPDAQGITPLMKVVDTARRDDSLSHPYFLEFAKLLLAKGADLNRKDNLGKNAADHAVEQGNYEMLLFLDVHQEHRTNYDAVKKRNLDELLSVAVARQMDDDKYAASGGLKKDEDDPVDAMAMIREDLHAGANPNFVLPDRRTTIFGQALGNSVFPDNYEPDSSLIKILIDHGADPNRRLPNGKSPLEAVVNYPEIYALLRANGAKPDRGLQLTFSANAAENDDIRESIFRHQIPHNASGQQGAAKVYFLEVQNLGSRKYVDPSAALMKRFANERPRVARCSECTASAAKGVKDKVTGESGLIFRVGFIKWISEDEVEADGGYYEGNLSASGNSYHLKKRGGKWVVVDDVMNWIS